MIKIRVQLVDLVSTRKMINQIKFYISTLLYNWGNLLPTSYNVKVWSVMRKDDAIEGLGGGMCAVSAFCLYQRQHQKKPIEYQ